MPSTSPRGAYRPRAAERREPRLHVWLTAAEWDTVTAAATRAGMAPGAYAAQALLDVAEHRTVNLSQLRQQMVVALMQSTARGQPHRREPGPGGGRLKDGGVPGPDLEAAARQSARVVRLVEEAAQLVRRRLS